MLRELTKQSAEDEGFAHDGHFHVKDILLYVAGFAWEEVFALVNTECMEPIMTAVIARFARVSKRIILPAPDLRCQQQYISTSLWLSEGRGSTINAINIPVNPLTQCSGLPS